MRLGVRVFWLVGVYLIRLLFGTRLVSNRMVGVFVFFSIGMRKDGLTSFAVVGELVARAGSQTKRLVFLTKEVSDLAVMVLIFLRYNRYCCDGYGEFPWYRMRRRLLTDRTCDCSRLDPTAEFIYTWLAINKLGAVAAFINTNLRSECSSCPYRLPSPTVLTPK